MIIALDSFDDYAVGECNATKYILRLGGEVGAQLIREESKVEVVYILQPDKISHFMVSKLLSYASNQATKIVTRGGENLISQEVKLFELWESFAKGFWGMNKSFAQKQIHDIATLMGRISFFSAPKNFESAVETIITIKSFFLELEFCVAVITPNRSFSFPHELKSEVRLLSKKINNLKLVSWVPPIAALKRLINATSFSEYLDSLSEVLFFVAQAKILACQFTEAVVLAHRALDTYFFSLLTTNQIREDSYLVDKYSQLISNNIIMPDSAMESFVKEINNFRNGSVYAHYDKRIEAQKAVILISQARSIIQRIAGKTMRIGMPELELFEVFRQEPSGDSYYKTV